MDNPARVSEMYSVLWTMHTGQPYTDDAAALELIRAKFKPREIAQYLLTVGTDVDINRSILNFNVLPTRRNVRQKKGS